MQPFLPSCVSTDMRNAELIPAAPSTDTVASVTCRPGKAVALWLMLPGMIAFYCGMMACLCLFSGPGSRGLAVTLAVCSAIGLLGMLPAIVWARRGAIIADEAGLRWRSLGAWKCVGWGEVDYHGRQSRQNASKTIVAAVIETTAGRIRFDSQWTNCEPLQEAVERRATGRGRGNGGCSERAPVTRGRVCSAMTRSPTAGRHDY